MMPERRGGNITRCLHRTASERRLVGLKKIRRDDLMQQSAPAFAGIILASCLLLSAWPQPAFSDGTSVYRCLAPDGAIEFRQTLCSAGADGEEISVDDRKTGWTPPTKAVDGPKRNDARRARDHDAGDSKDKRDEKCFKKRQQLQDINWQLRRGYKPSKGDSLRHRRRAYEEYLTRYCR